MGVVFKTWFAISSFTAAAASSSSVGFGIAVVFVASDSASSREGTAGSGLKGAVDIFES